VRKRERAEIAFKNWNWQIGCSPVKGERLREKRTKGGKKRKRERERERVMCPVL